MRLRPEADIRTGTLESVAGTKHHTGQYSRYACLREEGPVREYPCPNSCQGNHESGKTLTSFWVELLSENRAHKI